MEGYFIHIANKLEKTKIEHGQGKVDLVRELRTRDLWRAVLAELVATALFVFIGTMSAVSMTTGDDLNKIVRIALCFGLMIATCIQMFGHVSGGHMNPAVSIAMAVSGNITPTRAILYVIAQCCGGMLGSLLLKGVTPDPLHNNLGLTSTSAAITTAQGFGVTPDPLHNNLGLTSISSAITTTAQGFGVTPDPLHYNLGLTSISSAITTAQGFGVTPDPLHNNLGLTSISSAITTAQGFGCETVFTFILVMSIYGCTDSDRPMFGSPAVGIGLTIAVVHLAGIPFTGASMNPARSFASSVVSNNFVDHWVYWVGPVLGGILASLSYKYLFSPYRGKLSTEEAANVMHRGMILIPRDYFKGGNPDISVVGGNTKL